MQSCYIKVSFSGEVFQVFSIFGRWFCQNFKQIVSVIVKTLRNTRLGASRCFKMKKRLSLSSLMSAASFKLCEHFRDRATFSVCSHFIFVSSLMSIPWLPVFFSFLPCDGDASGKAACQRVFGRRPQLDLTGTGNCA